MGHSRAALSGLGRGHVRHVVASGRAAGAAGFSLVELLISVAIVGVLATLAVYGVSRYLRHAKTAEARHHVGAIARAAQTYYQRQHSTSALLGGGDTGLAATQALCGSAVPVPALMSSVSGAKYQPMASPGNDFDTGDALNGWTCLHFKISEPILYRYDYRRGLTGGLVAPDSPAAPTGEDSFEASAQGDLDGDDDLATFALTGQIDAQKELTIATSIHESDPEE